MRVLVVEDSESTRTLLEAFLSARGYDVYACADAESALVEYDRQAYPLVVLDWLLPGIDGLELCRRLRATAEGQSSFILMITARDKPEDLRAVLEAGADDYVAKPIDVDALTIRFTVAERQVENLLERKAAEAKLNEAFVQIEKSRDDMLSILNKSLSGTAMIDPRGRLSFVSRTCRSILDLGDAECVGRQWGEVLPLSAEDRLALRNLAEEPEESRSKLSATIDGPNVGRRWIDVDVRDDPRDPSGKILFFYDVSDLHALRLLLDEKAQFHDIVGQSGVMVHLFEQIRRIADVDSTVLIEGETGTGKELAARAIHYSGHRQKGPFVAVNCAGLTESLLASQLFGHKRGAFTGAVADHKGFFETADGGTIFLDEIGDVPASVQTMMLRVLQEREIIRVGESSPRKINVRVVAATHHDLAADVEGGTFRADLLYRIRVARLRLPPLRERREDIPLLVQTFLSQVAATRENPLEGVSKDAMRILMGYAWPGNVRELRSAIEYAVIRSMGSVLHAEDLPPELIAPAVQESRAVDRNALREDETKQILRVLEETRGNRSIAARRLGMSRSTFYRRLAELGLAAPTRR